MTKDRSRINYWMPMLMLVIGFFNLLFAEKIQRADGFGWDGVIYGSWAKDFFNEIFTKGWQDYFIQRILPSFVIHLNLRIFQLPLEDQVVIREFEIWNLMLLVFSAYVWGLVADRLQLTKRGKWLGFCGLFINYAILKMNFYYPVLTDTTAFALGLLSFYFYLSHRPIALLVVSFVGAFSWPTVFLFGLVLFIFSEWDRKAEMIRSGKSRRGLLIACLVTLLVLGLIIKVIVKTGFFVALTKTHVYQAPLLPVLNLSIFLVLLYAFFVNYFLFKEGPVFSKELKNRNNIKRFLIAFCCWAIVQWIIHQLAQGEYVVTPKRMIYRNITLGIQKPLIFAVSHVIYYGPILIFTIFLWKHFCKTVQQYGVGLLAIIAIGLFLGIGSESRQWINFFPMVIALTTKVIDSLNWKPFHYWLVGICSFLYSKVWLTINPMSVDDNQILSFPYQKYFMNHGPWMSDSMYVVQGSIVMITAILFYFIVARKDQP